MQPWSVYVTSSTILPSTSQCHHNKVSKIILFLCTPGTFSNCRHSGSFLLPYTSSQGSVNPKLSLSSETLSAPHEVRVSIWQLPNLCYWQLHRDPHGLEIWCHCSSTILSSLHARIFKCANTSDEKHSIDWLLPHTSTSAAVLTSGLISLCGWRWWDIRKNTADRQTL